MFKTVVIHLNIIQTGWKTINLKYSYPNIPKNMKTFKYHVWQLASVRISKENRLRDRDIRLLLFHRI